MIDDALIQRITRQVMQRMQDETAPAGPRPHTNGDKPQVMVNISVRHCHLCREHLEILYGSGSELEPRNPLYQPGEFASKSTVTLVGPRMRCLGEVRVLGPLRKATQVEVSRSGASYVGSDPPV